MTAFASYDDEGRILFKGDVPGTMLHLQPGNIYAGEVDINTDYIVDRQPIKRPPCPATLTGATLNEMPVPCTLLVNNTPYEVSEGTVELSFSKPGQYDLRIVSWPYSDGNFTLRI